MSGAPPNPTIFDTINANASVQNKYTSLLQQYENQQANTVDVQIVQGALMDDDIDMNSLAGMVITELNGSYALPNQKVVVEYLTQSERMLIPQALGMPLVDGVIGRCTPNMELRTRYWKVAGQSYTALKALVTANTGIAALRTAILALPGGPPAGAARFSAWDQVTWYGEVAEVEEGEVAPPAVIDSPNNVTAVFTQLSRAIQANCDVRDFGKLNDANMSVTDNEWQTAATTNYPDDRLRSKFHAFSVKCIAALNYTAVDSCFMAAMARAYGVAFGVLPAVNSQTAIEWSWTLAMPSAVSMAAITTGEMNATYNVVSLALNIISMFGVFHLNKDHTYRTNDLNMERIGRSYINTLRTITTSEVITDLISHQLAVVRTAAHPFGLAQTYWLFRIMNRFEYLSSPLTIRQDVKPPPLSRLEVVNAAKTEWTNLPIGSIINNLYRNEITLVENAKESIGSNAPSYSALHNLYGVGQQLELDTNTNNALVAMMPCVYGFSISQHTLSSGEKQGLALAQCFNNLLRDNKPVADMWFNLWDNYIASAMTTDLATFVSQNMNLLAGGTVGAPNAG